jgi:hypothetical protein
MTCRELIAELSRQASKLDLWDAEVLVSAAIYTPNSVDAKIYKVDYHGNLSNATNLCICITNKNGKNVKIEKED